MKLRRSLLSPCASFRVSFVTDLKDAGSTEFFKPKFPYYRRGLNYGRVLILQNFLGEEDITVWMLRPAKQVIGVPTSAQPINDTAS